MDATNAKTRPHGERFGLLVLFVGGSVMIVSLPFVRVLLIPSSTTNPIKDNCGISCLSIIFFSMFVSFLFIGATWLANSAADADGPGFTVGAVICFGIFLIFRVVVPCLNQRMGGNNAQAPPANPTETIIPPLQSTEVKIEIVQPTPQNLPSTNSSVSGTQNTGALML